MLISGDLVRIPQGTVINEESEKPLPLPIAIIATPAVGIVLDSRDEMVKVLMDGEVIYVEKKYLQLIGGN